MVEFLAPEGHGVLEVGPGDGALTTLLQEAGARRVIAVELDPAWGLRLGARTGRGTQLVIGDCMALSLGHLQGGARVTGNLPYGVATAFLEKLLDECKTTVRAAFLVQREVAARMTAAPGDSDYGALSVMVQTRTQPRALGTIAARDFRPRPKVDGGMVGLEITPAKDSWHELKSVVRAAFHYRRKTIANSLGRAWGRPLAQEVLAAAEIDPGARAQHLAVEELERLQVAYAARRTVERGDGE